MRAAKSSLPRNQGAVDSAPVLKSHRVPFYVPLLNPLMKSFLHLGVPAGPMTLLTVRGRKTGRLHTTPVGLFKLAGHRYVFDTFGKRGLGSEPTRDQRGGHRPRLEPETCNRFGAQHRQGCKSSERDICTVRGVSYPIVFPPNGIQSYERLHDGRLCSRGQASSRLRVAWRGVTRNARIRRSS